MTTIGSSAFRNCDNLDSIIFEDGSKLTIIGSFAFGECTKIASVTVPNGITSISNASFNGCVNLESVIIPESVVAIEDYAFYNCTNILNVYYCGTITDWSELTIKSANDYLTSATRYYYSETEPTEEGNFWHYDENGDVAVW